MTRVDVLGLVTGIGLGFVLLMGTAALQPAFSQMASGGVATTCNQVTIDGVYEVNDPETLKVSRITIEKICDQDQFQNLRVKTEMKCHPRDCSWGWADMVELTENGEIQAIFRTFSATRYMSLELIGSRLEGDVRYDFNQPGKPEGYERVNAKRKERSRFWFN